MSLESRQAEIYETFRKEFAAIVVRNGKPQLDDAEEILKRLLRLVQVASNPRLIDQSYHAIPGKFPKLLELVEDVFDRGEKAIVWTAFTANVDWLSRELRTFNAVRVHGKMAYDAGTNLFTPSRLIPTARCWLPRHPRQKKD